jgi:hypothetical protein
MKSWRRLGLRRFPREDLARAGGANDEGVRRPLAPGTLTGVRSSQPRHDEPPAGASPEHESREGGTVVFRDTNEYAARPRGIALGARRAPQKDRPASPRCALPERVDGHAAHRLFQPPPEFR